MVGLAFQYISWALPVKSVLPNKDVFVFHHPQPCYDHHLILSPKRPVRNLQQMAADEWSGYLSKIWMAAMEVHEKRSDVYKSFKLVANGGKYQEVQQVHFRLFTSRSAMKERGSDVQDGNIFYQNEEICVFEHPCPEREIHFVLKPVRTSQEAYFKNVLQSIDLLDKQFQIVQKGYSLVYQHIPQKNDQEIPVFHMISGPKRV